MDAFIDILRLGTFVILNITNFLKKGFLFPDLYILQLDVVDGRPRYIKPLIMLQVKYVVLVWNINSLRNVSLRHQAAKIYIVLKFRQTIIIVQTYNTWWAIYLQGLYQGYIYSGLTNIFTRFILWVDQQETIKTFGQLAPPMQPIQRGKAQVLFGAIYRSFVSTFSCWATCLYNLGLKGTKWVILNKSKRRTSCTLSNNNKVL